MEKNEKKQFFEIHKKTCYFITTSFFFFSSSFCILSPFLPFTKVRRATKKATLKKTAKTDGKTKSIEKYSYVPLGRNKAKMRVRSFIYALAAALCINSIFAYRRLKDINNLQILSQGFKAIKPTNFHQIRSRAKASAPDQLNIDIGDWTIYITHKTPYYNTEKIKTILIYSMTYPFKELEEFKEYLFED
ncbi:hypothetical protein, conserved [Plasmodium vivax]|uniref:Uncharacterized protein n=1 Tax=Plasmodium vivax (strain Salvador I) TaxID=126793 RepID=A5JZV8_PLAVS|nr:hypothetical protein, conserved [Plasmodium vivax]EDL47519.1 hypothetical protein, conserved [Plasmodium vivax]|eukprot:XP_001617246.1 hypothetical protein [Plasmodium vivax Sal-1]